MSSHKVQVAEMIGKPSFRRKMGVEVVRTDFMVELVLKQYAMAGMVLSRSLVWMILIVSSLEIRVIEPRSTKIIDTLDRSSDFRLVINPTCAGQRSKILAFKFLHFLYWANAYLQYIQLQNTYKEGFGVKEKWTSYGNSAF
ncbi:uncharacterized protein H6S33_003284 [Morchella sextelata]|uniref:uncharacterized protein n=1 Tax=Morchella sextelata TaxID=1174677 RepID=UPI001D038B6E|nr:uncharacterized protein H6S33_003284 [Morchella sextelata]KAH0607296.1 hypothetical protein H6S33_003284 [Morchella sextelata]